MTAITIPNNEDEVIALVKYAAKNKLQIRARGASHSTAWSIFTDPVDGKPENRTLTRTPPAGSESQPGDGPDERGSDWIDEANGIVEAEAGIHLGADPYDPIGGRLSRQRLVVPGFQEGLGAQRPRRDHASDDQRLHRDRLGRRIASVRSRQRHRHSSRRRDGQCRAGSRRAIRSSPPWPSRSVCSGSSPRSG